MECRIVKCNGSFEGDGNKDRVLQMHPIRSAQIVARAVHGRDSSQHRVCHKNLTLAREVEDLRIGPGLDLAGKSIGMGNLLYVGLRIKQDAEGIEVIKQSGCVVHDEADLGDRLFVRVNMMIPIRDKVRKDVGEMIALISATAGPRTGCRDALDQRDLRQVVQDAFYALAGDGVGVEEFLVVEIKRSLRSR